MRRTRVYRALNEPRLVFGLDRMCFLLLVALAAGLIIIFKGWWIILPITVVFFALRQLFKFDPLYMAIYSKFSAEADHYDPWVRALAPASRRKKGRGKGVLC